MVVVGGGYGGATAARFLKALDASLDVTLVEPNESLHSCPLSNLVLGGFRSVEEQSWPYAGLEARGVRVVRDRATRIDAGRKAVRLARGADLPFDRAVVSPGIDFLWDELPALGDAAARAAIPHAWQAGPQTAALRAQLEAMPDGGTFVISIPEAPLRCPPAPYERACQAAAYFTSRKPRSKILVVDANADVLAEGALFKKAWRELYPGMIEYRPDSRAVDVDVATRTVKLEFGEARGDVVNVIPPMRAGDIAAPFITANGRWCEVDWLTYESKAARGVHVLGDSLQIAPLMPKSGSMAHAQGRVCAAAIASLLAGREPDPAPTLEGECYSFVSGTLAGRVASRHAYDAAEATMKVVPGSQAVSAEATEAHARAAFGWARTVRAAMLG